MNRVKSDIYCTDERTLEDVKFVTKENALEIVQVVLGRGGVLVPVDPAWDDEDVISTLVLRLLTNFLGKPIGGTIVFLRLWWIEYVQQRRYRKKVESSEWRSSVRYDTQFASSIDGYGNRFESADQQVEGSESGTQRWAIEQDMRGLLKQLPERHRRVLTLRLNGFGFKYIGEKIEVTRQRAEQIFHRAVEKCRELYASGEELGSMTTMFDEKGPQICF